MRHEASYLEDALAAITELREFTGRTSRERFLASPLEQSYVFHRLVIFGEALARLAPTFQTKYTNLPWGPAISLRNRLVHAYFDLDIPLLWEIATTRTDEIVSELRTIRETEFPDSKPDVDKR